MENSKVFMWAFIATVCSSASLAASDAVIRGTVTDNTGKPIRGAIVKVQTGYKLVTRYSQKDGRYEIAVPAGTYVVTAEALGYSSKREDRDTAQAGEINFKLPPRAIDVTRLTGAEIVSLLPNDAETRLIQASCYNCHSMQHMMLKRGSTAEQWRDFLPTMSRGRVPVAADPKQNPRTTQASFVALTNALGKYFGPDAPFFGPDSDPPTLNQIQRAELSDVALNATIREYEIPTTMPMAHSMSVDTDRGIAWWGEESHLANKVGRFNMDTETFVEYPVATPNATVHTGIVGKDGRYWVTLPSGGDSKIVSVEPETGKVTEYKWPEKKGNPHTLALDRAGNLVMSGGASGEVWTFDTETYKFGFHAFPVPPSFPEDSVTYWEKIPGEKLPAVSATTYDIKINSKGKYFFTIYSMGTLMSLDPATGESKTYHPEGTPSMRGLDIDAQDNVWFSNYNGHKLGKLDGKTGMIKEYQPPTLNATPYGVKVDKAGNVWFSDLVGNNLTKFDPKTEQFVEYPLPTRDAGPKFMDMDAKGRIWFTEVMGAKIGMVETGDAGEQMASTK
jgi:virginiamycin B lyase